MQQTHTCLLVVVYVVPFIVLLDLSWRKNAAVLAIVQPERHGLLTHINHLGRAECDRLLNFLFRDVEQPEL